MRRLLLLWSLLALSAGCATQPPAPMPAPAAKAPIVIAKSQSLAPAPALDAQPSGADPDAEQVKLLQDASFALKAGLAQQAIDNALDPVIATFE